MLQLKNKRVLVLGLGLLSGGVATTTWLLNRGAKVTVTDLKDAKQLAPSIRRIEQDLRRTAADGRSYKNTKARLLWALGEQSNALIDQADILMVSSEVPFDDPAIQYAIARGKTVCTEGILFCDHWGKKIIGITGARGKTTAATWAAHLIGTAALAGISPDRPFLAVLAIHAPVAVTVLPASQAKFPGVREPDLLLTTDAPEAATPEESSALTGFVARWGRHNIPNALIAMRAARWAGVPWERIRTRLSSLPQVPYRQQIVHQSRMLTIINDTTAISPEGGIAALERWGGPNCILITGGTDQELEYSRWADTLSKHVRPSNTVFLAGSATDKMRSALGRGRIRGIRTYDSLERCWLAALDRAGKYVHSVVLFSPAARSFELFANEFDRGQRFNAFVKRDLK